MTDIHTDIKGREDILVERCYHLLTEDVDGWVDGGAMSCYGYHLQHGDFDVKLYFGQFGVPTLRIEILCNRIKILSANLPKYNPLGEAIRDVASHILDRRAVEREAAEIDGLTRLCAATDAIPRKPIPAMDVTEASTSNKVKWYTVLYRFVFG